jgi:hypothetical protein
MRTGCIVKLSKLQISELNTLVQKETSGDVEGNHLLRTDCNPKAYGFGASEPIDKRAWTLQEQMIPRQLLQYTSHTLQWKCATTTVNLGESLYWEET